MMYQLTELACAIELSERWLSKIDRTRLGSFAADEEAITIFQAYLLAVNQQQKRALIDALWSAFTVLWRQDDDEYTDNREIILKMYTETYFLWQRFGDIPLQNAVKSKAGMLGEVAESIDKLNIVYDHPHLDAFFQAGIWDITTATKFLEDGIDAELGKVLFNSSAQRFAH